MSGKIRFVITGFALFCLSLIILIVYQFQQNILYNNFENEQSLQNWIINGVKSKDRAKVRIPLCLEPTMENSPSDLDSAFEIFWNGVAAEDWSQAEIKNVSESDRNKNYTFVVKNIRSQNGEIGNRYFSAESRYRNRGWPILVQLFSQQHICFQPNLFLTQKESYEFENPSPSVEKPEVIKDNTFKKSISNP